MKLISIILVLCILSISSVNAATEEKVTVTVRGANTIAKTDESFVCVCIDWWPANKCNYNWCPWGNSSALNLDLDNTLLQNALAEFRVNPKDSTKEISPLRARIGGSLQDQVIYKVGSNRPKCPKFRLIEDGRPFNFTEGCLNMCRWNKINEFFQKTGVVLTFGLNAMLGRTLASKQQKGGSLLYEGKWNDSNAKAFMNYTASKGFNIDTWEFGNEVGSSGVHWRVEAKTYAEDLKTLRKIIEELYKDQQTKPKLVAPGSFFDEKWFADMLKISGPGVVDVVTHHIYNMGPGDNPELFAKLQDPFHLSKIVQTFRDLELTINRYGPWSEAWVGESGGAFNSGGPESHTFVNSFWYLDQLGMAATFNSKVYCRQALVGGNYQLIDRDTFVPNPDYYSALLWHRLMGKGVLQVSHNGSPYLRAYAHCGRDNGEATLLFINLSNTTSFDISVTNDMNLYPPGSEVQGKLKAEREDYYLTPKCGDLRSQVMLLNGKPLVLNGNKIPEMKPIEAKANAPIKIVKSSFAFIKFRDFGAPACPRS